MIRSKSLVEKNKYVDGIQLVKGFEIIKTYPLIGNEKTIGYNLTNDELHKKAAKDAIKKIKYFLKGIHSISTRRNGNRR